MRLYLDARSIIYSIEGTPRFQAAVQSRIATAESSPGGVLLTSRLSRLECRVKPLRDKQLTLLSQYDGFFTGSTIVLVDISDSIIDRATALRATYGFKAPDAIHLATAINENTDVFLTGDGGLARCTEIKIELI